MAKFSWLDGLLNKSVREENNEVKALRARVENMAEQRSEFEDYDAKFYDAEPNSYSGGANQSEYGGIDQLIDDATLQRIYCTETWVYIAVTTIAKTIAGLPIKLEKKTKVSQRVTNEVTNAEEIVESDKWVDATGEKFFDRFQYPNAFTTKAEFFMLLTIDLLTTGHYYVYIDSDEDLSLLTQFQGDDSATSPFGRLRDLLAKNAVVKGMYRIPPALIKPVCKEDGYGIEGYVMTSDRGQFGFDPAEIIHVKLPNPLKSHVGLSPLYAAFKPVLLDRYSTEHMVRFYKTGARLGGIIETEKTLNKEQLSRFQRSFENNYTGRQNFHRTLILPPGMKYREVEQNPAETALLEFCKYNREAILAVYNLPPIKAGIMDDANYANALVQLKIYFTDTVMPYLSFMEDGFNLKNTLMPDTRSFRFKFDLTEVEALKENNKEMAETAKFMIEAGLSTNEVRRRIWKAAPVKGGDKVKSIEDLDKPAGGFPMFNLSAQEGDVKDGAGPAPAPLAGLPGPMVTTIMNILGRVGKGRITVDSAKEMLLAFGLPVDTVCGLLGIESPAPEAAKDAVTPAPQPDSAAIAGDLDPTKITYSDRVAQLTELFMQRDKLPLAEAVRRAVEQAIAEGFKPENPEPNGPGNGGAPAPNSEGEPEEAAAPTLDEYLAEQLAQLDPNEQVTSEFIAELTALYEEEYGKPEGKGGDTPMLAGQDHVYHGGHTKESIVAHWKGLMSAMDPIIAKRQEELKKFFNAVRSITMKQLGANVKAYGLVKARDNDDSEEILDPSNYEAAINEYIKAIDAALLDAYKHGYVDTLANVKFEPVNEKAVEALRKYAASRVKGILDTTRDQLKDVLTEAFGEGVAVTEVAQRINEKFAEIDAGRAMTIARTETLTAVSIGREEKREEFQKQFPDQKLRKMWVSAQDEKVRDSHVELDGQTRPADEEFKSGLKFPRDPDCGDASEVINCRCTDITYLEEDEQAIADTLPVQEEGEKAAPSIFDKMKPCCDECNEPHAKDCKCPNEEEGKGGPGSGCHGENCGRRPSGAITTPGAAPITVVGNRGRDGNGTGIDDTPVRVGESLRPPKKPKA